MPNGNYIIHLIVGLIKKTLYKMGQYFPKPYKSFGRNINDKVDLFDYATKPDLKNAGTDTSNFALNSNLSSLKTEVDKLDIDKLKPVPIELSKLSNIVKNNVAKKIVYNKLVAKVNNVDTSGFVLKTKYHRDKSDIEKKKTDYNAKISEIEKKVADRNHDKYITTPKLDRFTAEIFAARLAKAHLRKTDFDTRLTSPYRKINSNKTKH